VLGTTPVRIVYPGVLRARVIPLTRDVVCVVDPPHLMSADPPLPPEPKTPNWLPALGAALFFLVFVWWLATPSKGAPPADSGADAGATSP
jgi:hypothetical protein